jgi:hypothetical protein
MNKLDYPKKKSSAEIGALLWYFLRKRKIDAKLQVIAHNTESGKVSAKLDLVIFVNEEAVCIVECKSWSDNYERTAIYRTNNTKQIKKYKQDYNIPVLVCARANFIDRTIALIERIIKNPENYKPIIKSVQPVNIEEDNIPF